MAHTGRPSDIPSVCIVPAFCQVVRFGTSWLVLFTCLCLHTSQLLAASAFSVFALAFFPRSHGTNLSACGCLLAPLSGITLTTQAIRSQHYILSNSYKLVRAPRPLCRCRPPHDSHMMQRLQVPCLAHRPGSVLLIHRFGRAPPALSQMAFCQLRSLRLPRSSPLLPFWSVASLLTLPRRPSYQSPPHLWMPLRRLSHTAASRDASTQLSFREFLAPPSVFDVRCPACARPVPSLPLDAAVQTPLHSVATHDASTQLPLTEFFIGCIFSNETAKARLRYIAMLAAPHLHNPLTLPRFAAPAAQAMPKKVTGALRPHTSY